MGSLNDFAASKERPAAPAEAGKGLRAYQLLLLQLAFSMLFVLTAFFISYAADGSAEKAASFLRQGLSMQNSWLFAEQVLPAETAESFFRLPCSGAIRKAYVKNSEGGLDIAGFAIAGEAGESVYPAAAGSVSRISLNDGVYTLQIEHDGDMYTVYSGLTELLTAEGAEAETDTPLGRLGNEGLLFAVYINGSPVDPEALFSQIGN